MTPIAALHLRHPLALWQSLEERRAHVGEARQCYQESWSLPLAIPDMGPYLVACFLVLMDDPGHLKPPKLYRQRATENLP